MILPKPQDALHRGQMFRLLIEIVDNKLLSDSLVFKGGTCATMLGYLDRFSVDIDFDLLPSAKVSKVREELEKIFLDLDLSIKDQSDKSIQYHLRYKAPENERNTLKVDIIGTVDELDVYSPQRLPDIERYMDCQTIESMFAHKLVALTDRYKKHKRIAGRDVYDIYHFFISGYDYNKELVSQRVGMSTKDYLVYLVKFLQTVVTDEVVTQDLNMLLGYKEFNKVRKSLRVELIAILNDEIKRVS